MAEGFWRTSISKVEPNKVIVRGYDLAELIGRVSFGDAVYLLMTGDLPPANEGRMIDAILVSACDHGLSAPSADATRFVASGGVPLQASVAAGILAIGESHAGAIEACARILQEALAGKRVDNVAAIAREIVGRYRSEKRRIPGYGHPYHTADPRVGKLFALSDDFALTGDHIGLAIEIERELKSGSGGKIGMNVDGAIAAIISDMGIDWRLGKGFFIIARSAGLIAHAHEQMTQEKPFKAVPLDEICYTGPDERPFRKQQQEEGL